MRPLAWILAGLIGVACTDDGKTGDDTGQAEIGDDTGDAPDLDGDGDGFDGGDDGDDCDDEDASIYPGAEEVAYDGIDQDCDDADLTDVDGDGFDGGDAGDDCDDEDATVYPAADEVAYDGIDQDCDGTDLTDVDGDGFDGGDDGEDCDDEDAGINPSAEEVAYDGIDQNCDDADLTDVDGDGYDGGDEGDDCNDDDAAIYPGAEDAWYDGVDADCAGDDDYDADADGYVGDDYVGLETGGVEGSGALPGGECDDADSGINPAAEDVAYDGIDQDCDGADLTDVDGDGYDATVVDGGTDCDDTDATIHPDADDTADLVDTDCDGLVDDDSIEPGDIVMTEAMINPYGTDGSVPDGDGEWLELHNTTDYDINIVGWTFSDAELDEMIVDEDVIVPAGGYIVMGVNGDEETNGGVTVDHVYPYGSLRLANTDDELFIDMGDVEMYEIAWIAGPWPYASGYTMGWDGYGDYADSDSWCAQSSMLSGGDYGTPGAENDSCFDGTCASSEMEVGVLVVGDTSVATDDYAPSCAYVDLGYDTGPDHAHSYTASSEGCYEFAVSAPGWNAMLAVIDECGGDEVACGESSYLGYDSETGSYLYGATSQVALGEGQSTLVVVDGAIGIWDDFGLYELEVALADDVEIVDLGGTDLGSATGDSIATGTTAGAEDFRDPSCGGSGVADAAYEWTAPSDGCWDINTVGSGIYDTILSVYTDGGFCGSSETCNDDGAIASDPSGSTYQSRVEVDLLEGDGVQILITGYSSSYEGDYVLNISACE